MKTSSDFSRPAGVLNVGMIKRKVSRTLQLIRELNFFRNDFRYNIVHYVWIFWLFALG